MEQVFPRDIEEGWLRATATEGDMEKLTRPSYNSARAGLFEEIAAMPWTADQIRLVQAAWNVYEEALYYRHVAEKGDDALAGACWGVAQVLAAAKILAGMTGRSVMDFVADDSVALVVRMSAGIEEYL